MFGTFGTTFVAGAVCNLSGFSHFCLSGNFKVGRIADNLCQKKEFTGLNENSVGRLLMLSCGDEEQ